MVVLANIFVPSYVSLDKMSKNVKINDFPKTKSLVSLAPSFSTVPSLFELHMWVKSWHGMEKK